MSSYCVNMSAHLILEFLFIHLAASLMNSFSWATYATYLLSYVFHS